MMRLAMILTLAGLLGMPAALVRGDAPPATRTAETSPADAAEFAARRKTLKADDFDGWLALARWARDRRLWDEAQEAAQAVIYHDPGNRAAFLVLQQVDDARPLPDEPAMEAELRGEFTQRFKHEFKTRTTRHFVIVHDTADAFATARGAAMERVYNAFLFYFNMNTLRPQFLKKRLVVVLLAKREDYLAYMKQSDGMEMNWSSGYYSQRTNRTAFYDEAASPQAVGYVKEVEDLKAKVERLGKEIDDPATQADKVKLNRLMVERTRTAEALQQASMKLNNALLIANNSKTLHEAAHQVSFNMGIQKRLVDYPMWFAEGLACSFETEDSMGRKGPAVVNPGRIAAVKEAIKGKRLLTIEELVTRGAPDEKDEPSLGVFYGEGWGLFHYLYKYQREGMEKYLKSFHELPILRPLDGDRRRQMFVDAFGDDFAGLNKKFEAYLRSLPPRTP